MNRAIQGVTIFATAADYHAFGRLVADVGRRHRIELFAYCLMPNHWHLVVRPAEGFELSRYMKSLTGTHAVRWRRASGTSGRGAVYQGRFYGVPVEADLPFLRVCRYVERNPVRAGLVARAEEWRWSSAAAESPEGCPTMAAWPVARPNRWQEIVNTPQPGEVVRAIRRSLARRQPYGDRGWRAQVRRSLEPTEPRRGRPRGTGSVTTRSIDFS